MDEVERKNIEPTEMAKFQERRQDNIFNPLLISEAMRGRKQTASSTPSIEAITDREIAADRMVRMRAAKLAASYVALRRRGQRSQADCSLVKERK